jgi:hypothetical protein
MNRDGRDQEARPADGALPRANVQQFTRGTMKTEGAMVVTRWFLFGFISLVGLTAGAHAADWKQHRYTADGFQIEFSGQISVKETEMSAETREKVVRSTQYIQDGGPYAYLVTVGLYKGGVNFEAGIKSSLANSQCKTSAGKAISIPGATQGREVLGTGCKHGRWEARYFARDKSFYFILAIFPEDGDAESARYFLNSFKLL